MAAVIGEYSGRSGSGYRKKEESEGDHLPNRQSNCHVSPFLEAFHRSVDTGVKSKQLVRCYMAPSPPPDRSGYLAASMNPHHDIRPSLTPDPRFSSFLFCLESCFSLHSFGSICAETSCVLFRLLIQSEKEVDTHIVIHT